MLSSEARHYLGWLKVTRTTDSVTGQVKETFSSNGSLWGNVVEETGRREDDYNSRETGQYATIKIMNRPALSPLDRLTFAGKTWLIDTIFQDIENDELTCDCYSYDVLVI